MDKFKGLLATILAKLNVKILSVLTIFLILLSACGVSTETKEDKPLYMGFVPLKDSETMVEDIKPLEEALAKELNRPVKAFISSNYVGIVTGLNADKIDFAFIPPFAYVLAEKSGNVHPHLVTVNSKGKTGYTSTIYVNKDSDIKSVKDLRGKKIAFVDFSSTSGYIFPAALLAEQGLVQDKDYELVISGGHDKALSALLDKKVEAAAVFTDAPKRFLKDRPDFENAFTSLVETKTIPGISLVTTTNFEKQELNNLKLLKEALHKVQASESGKKLLENLFGIYGFLPIDKSQFAVVRSAAESLDIDLSKVAK